MNEVTDPEVVQTKVTLANVKAAVEEIAGGNPNKTNASAIRRHLQRGSNATIQLHLYALREELRNSSVIETSSEQLPMPISEMQAVWLSASIAAQKASYHRLIVLQKERDEALTLTTTLDADLKAALAENDSLLSEITLLELNSEQMHSAAEIEKSNHQNHVSAIDEEHRLALAELNSTITHLQTSLNALQHKHTIEKISADSEKSALERVISQQTLHLAQLQKLLDQVRPMSVQASTSGH